MAFDQIPREYNRFLCVKKIVANFLSLANSQTQKYEIENIIEKLLITITNENLLRHAESVDAIFYSLKITSPSIMKAIQECRAKLPKNAHRFIEGKFHNFIRVVDKFLNNSQDKIDAKFIVKNGKFIFGEYEYQMDERRLNVLIKRAITYDKNNISITNEDALYRILCMLLRYECLYPRGQQWGFSEEMYRNLAENFNVCLECFASPKNSQIIMISETANFCSLFFDTDKYFGSLGNFFDINLAIFQPISLMVGPAYIESLMIEASKKVLTALAKGINLRIIYNGPRWTDSEFWILLKNSKFLQYDQEMLPNQHYYMDIHASKKIIAKFASHIFVLESSPSENAPNYDNLTIGYLNI
jgi:Phosphorylated CTD interacting factor 1 WW domain